MGNIEKEMEKIASRKFILSSQLVGIDTVIEKMKETFSRGYGERGR